MMESGENAGAKKHGGKININKLLEPTGGPLIPRLSTFLCCCYCCYCCCSFSIAVSMYLCVCVKLVASNLYL